MTKEHCDKRILSEKDGNLAVGSYYEIFDFFILNYFLVTSFNDFLLEQTGESVPV